MYYKSRSSNVASTGILRLANAETGIVWRNFLNNADLALTVNASNQLTFNGTPIESNALTSAHILVGNASNIATDVAMTGDISITNAGVIAIGAGKIVNAQVNASAAIAYSKLALTGSILNADLAGSIAYSKLILTDSVVNADINSAAAIAYAKLALTGSILNADVNASAAIAYSKLALSNSIVNADVNSAAAIVRSKLVATETVDLTFASGKGIFYTDSGSKTVKMTAPTTLTNTYALKWPLDQGASNQYLTNDGAGNLSWTNAAGTGTVNSGTQYQLGYYATSTNAMSGLTLITASRALASDANGLPVAQTDGTTSVELGYVHGVTSAIQTQMNLKAPLAGPTFIGTVTIPTPFTLGAVSVTATGTELNYVAGVTSAIQTQMNLKAPLASPVFTGTVKFTAPTSNTDGIRLISGSTEVFDINFYANNGSTNTGFIELGSGGTPYFDLYVGSYLVHGGSATGFQHKGTTTNDNADAGFVGETSRAVGGGNFPTSAQYGDLASFTLAAGDWLVSGCYQISNTGTVTTLYGIGITTTSGNSSAGTTQGDNLILVTTTAGSSCCMGIPSYRMSLSTSTTVYLKYVATYSGTTPVAVGRISAVRIR